MALPSSAFRFLVACQLFSLVFQSHCTTIDLDLESPSNAVFDKVNISVYYNVLNLDCATFIIRDLSNIFNDGLSNIVDLRLIPVGDISHVDQLNSVSNACQSGLDECQLSTLHACTINAFPDVNKHFALIYCFEFLVIEGRSKEWSSCFSSLDLPSNPVMECLNGTNGKQLVQNYAGQTAQLVPSLTLEPWVIVNNNESISNDYGNFTSHACKAYKGTSLPAVCHTP